MPEMTAQAVLPGCASGRLVSTGEALSFWGGVDPLTGSVIDTHHPLHGVDIAGAVLVMPTSRGSCSGSGVLLDLALNGKAPAALIFSEPEDVITLGALVAAEMFDRPLPVLRLSPDAFRAVAKTERVEISPQRLTADGLDIAIAEPDSQPLALSAGDQAMLAGEAGAAAQQAMRILAAMARQQGATHFIDVTQVHIDGCIYAGRANLTFAERMAALGGIVRVPATTNAISVDRRNWQAQGVDPAFGEPAARLADAYVQIGCAPSFTCAPYLLETAPRAGECIGWSESNAVIFANSVLGARTAKHPDFLDLCIALTGRAPFTGVYRADQRKARRILDIDWPTGAEAAIWPLIGYLAGKAAPDCIPLLRGLEVAAPRRDDLKALCAAFGTTSAAPMLHIAGHTPEAEGAALANADVVRISRADMAAAYLTLNAGAEAVDLVAIGSPHASYQELEAVARALAGRKCHSRVSVIVTTSRHAIATAQQSGVFARLEQAGVRVVPDLCWCSITEPVFPPHARTVMTDSGKYAHYGPGLSGRTVRFASFGDCIEAALNRDVPVRLPAWLA